MQYDPCTCYYASRLVVAVELINQANVDISGSANGKLLAIQNNTGQVNQEDNTFTFADLQAGYEKASKTFKTINKFKDDQFSAINKMLANDPTKATEKKNSLTTLQSAIKGSGFLKAGLAAAPYIGAAIGLFDFFTGGGKKTEPTGPQEVQLTPTSIDMSIKLSGTITSVHPYGDATFWNPGSNFTTFPEDYPYYNEIMGVFNLTETPVIKSAIRQERFGPTRPEVMTFYDYTVSQPIKYAINPAARLALQDAQVALVVEGDSTGLDEPGGSGWIMEGKDEKNNIWQYRSDYVDVNCLKSTWLWINASPVAGKPKWVPRGRFYLKFLLNFKRLLDTAGAQNVLLVAKYPVKIAKVTDIDVDASAPCDGSFFLHATNAEINSLCTSSTYKTNRVQRRRPDTLQATDNASGLESVVSRAVLSPNPTSSFSDLLIESGKKIRLNVYVTDMTGRRVLTVANNKYYPEGTSNEKIDVAFLPNGVYHVVVENKNDRMVRKLVLQR